MRTVAFAWLALFAFVCHAEAQAQTTQATQTDKTKKQKPAPPPPPQKDPQPLFGGKIPARSSQNTKESATLGFNGIDPSGKVDKRMMAATPKPGDVEKVQNMDAIRPTAAEVVAFAKQGGLKTK